MDTDPQPSTSSAPEFDESTEFGLKELGIKIDKETVEDKKDVVKQSLSNIDYPYFYNNYLLKPEVFSTVDLIKVSKELPVDSPFKRYFQCFVVGLKLKIFTLECIKKFAWYSIDKLNECRTLNRYLLGRICTHFENFASYMFRNNLTFNNMVEFLSCYDGPHHAVLKVCRHLHINIPYLKLCNVIAGRLDYNGTNIDERCPQCEEGVCLWDWPDYRPLLMRLWISNDYVYNKCLRNKQYDVLPNYFQENKISISMDWLEKVKAWLSHQWQTNIKPCALKFFNFLKNHMPYIMAVILMGVGVFGVVRSVQQGNEIVEEAKKTTNIIESANKWTAPQSVYAPSDVKNTHSVKNVHVQGCQQVAVVEELAKKNMFYLIWRDTHKNIKHKYRCFSTGGHVGVGLRHYLENMSYQYDHFPGRYQLEIEYMHKSGHDLKCESILYDFLAFKNSCKLSNKSKIVKLDLEAPTSNLVVFLLPRQIPDFKDLLKFIALETDLNMVGNRGKFVFGDQTSVDIDLQYEQVHNGLGQYIPRLEKDGMYTGPIHLINWWKYDLQKPGYCGSLIICPHLQRPIVGIHVGGNSDANFGFAEIICYESFNTNPYVHEAPYEFSCIPDLLDEAKTSVKLQGPLTVVGYVDKKHAKYQPTDTKIVPSLMHGLYPITTAPNPLHRNDPRLTFEGERDPLTLGVNKHGLFVKTFPIEHIDRAFEQLKSKILAEVKPITRVEVISDQVAVCGHPDVPEYEALAWTTSAGYPLSALKPSNLSGKQWLFNLSAEADGYHLDPVNPYHPELASLLAINRGLRKNNYKPFTVFTDCLKDTCISNEKCSLPGKTRIFSISPVQFTIDYRKHFQVFMGSYRRHRIVNESAIGINPDSMQWTQLHNYLSAVGTKFVVGDYSNFGPGLNLTVAYKAAMIMVEWNRLWGFSDEDINVCKILQCELLFRYHLCNNIVYYPPAGSPSGGPSTDIINTLVNCLYIRCAWLGLTSHSLITFEEKVRMVCYGDDIIMCIADDVIDEFNGITISNYFASFGIKFTDVSKTGDPVKYKNLSECDFIKRKFVSHPFRSKIFLAPVDLNSVHSCINWVHNSLSSREAMAANLNAARELLFGHGPTLYEIYMRQLTIKSSLKLVKFFPVPWCELDSRNFEDVSKGDYKRRVNALQNYACLLHNDEGALYNPLDACAL